MHKNFIGAVAIALVTGGCASTPDDPLNGYNRAMFSLNEGIDKAVLAPAAKTYEAIVPKFVRRGSSNFWSNLNEPLNFGNKLLQGDVDGAADVTGRFLMNSTVGLFGLIDVASMDGIPKHSEDFGQTLAVWGMPSGPFIVLPFLGPSNIRDTLGRVVDSSADPLNYVDLDSSFYISQQTLELLDLRVEIDDALTMSRQQLDPYTAQKRGYEIVRQSQIKNGASDQNEYETLPDFDDFGEF